MNASSLPVGTPEPPSRPAGDIAVAVTLSLLTGVVFGGNLLVVVSVGINRRLRTVTNCFLTSLAAADCLVAALVMPLGVYLTWNHGEWTLGQVLCDLWVSADIGLCTASILNLVAISVDRYLAITYPMAYRVRRSRCLALAMIASVWLLAATITFPPLLFGWRGRKEESRSENSNRCTLFQNQGYVVYSAVGSFFIPLLVMLYVYIRIFTVIFRRESRKRMSQKYSSRHRQSSYSPPDKRPTEEVGQLIAHIGGVRVKKQRQYDSMKADKKAAKTLAVIVGCFTICWLPFFISYLVEGLCKECRVSDLWNQIFTWLGYANSALNPLIYAWYNREFRATFWRLTCGVRCCGKSADGGGGGGGGGGAERRLRML